jgi:thiol-disulfide isomerase/thioredoxin
MSPRVAIVAGLVGGLATGALVIGGFLALAPAPVPAAPQTAVPSAAAVTPTPPAGPSAVPSSPASASLPRAVPSQNETQALFHIGEEAPSLVVPQVGGGEIDLQLLRGKPVWVNFTGTYCPSCRDEFPLMNGFGARYADEDLVILAIDVKEEEGIVAAFATELGATFPLGLDGDGSAADRWDAVALPVHFWIDRDGIIRDGALGGIGPDVMAAGLQTILPGVEVTP